MAVDGVDVGREREALSHQEDEEGQQDDEGSLEVVEIEAHKVVLWTKNID